MKTNLSFRTFAVLALFLAIFVAGCAGVNTAKGMPDTDGGISGFWAGRWHGLILPIGFVVSLFNGNVNLYDVHNSGSGYNWGFMIGIGFLYRIPVIFEVSAAKNSAKKELMEELERAIKKD